MQSISLLEDECNKIQKINYKYYTNLEIELKNNTNRLKIELYKLKQEFDNKYNKIEIEHINLKKNISILSLVSIILFISIISIISGICLIAIIYKN